MKIFISYRRDDARGEAGRIHDYLVPEFGRERLFMDVDAIPVGVDFEKALTSEVEKCDALLAVIGPRWSEAVDQDGNRRLDDPDDFVRIEIAAALKRDIPVVPVVLDGARVPRAMELPEDLMPLAKRNAAEIRHSSFHSDMERLVRGLKHHQIPRIEVIPQEVALKASQELKSKQETTPVYLPARAPVPERVLIPASSSDEGRMFEPPPGPQPDPALVEAMRERIRAERLANETTDPNEKPTEPTTFMRGPYGWPVVLGLATMIVIFAILEAGTGAKTIFHDIPLQYLAPLVFGPGVVVAMITWFWRRR